MLAALAHLDHLLLVGPWGFAYLPPSSNLKSFGYIPIPVKVLVGDKRDNPCDPKGSK
ncbi:MAG: hypothetical protein QS721_02060 [Candidatus Endonucleobacter sp. (ex Gigantidas childressi)]|nr:hypothetical protein [Candidatus Endonucleobacter sp. (ex Gigantidas childressi)]